MKKFVIFCRVRRALLPTICPSTARHFVVLCLDALINPSRYQDFVVKRVKYLLWQES